ncbi:MAG: CoA ester lyase [Candidatus Saccharibacteria bacterium]|nr:CoA ester lyase [Pseudorhodobacter sp.]
MIQPLVWQAILFVPVGAERHLASAIRLRPDAVILDLEDAVAPDAKPAARAALRGAQAALARARIDCALRVNGPLRAMVDDLTAADLAQLRAVIVPKCEDTRGLRNAAELTAGQIALIALIESPLGLHRLPKIAKLPEVRGLMLGPEDYAATLGVNPDKGALDLVAAQLAIAASPRGLLPIGFPGSIANFRDLDLYASQIARGRDLGMRAVAAIHPAQLPVIRALLAPSEAEVAWAETVLAKASVGGAVFALDGAMVDAPVIARARQISAASRRA